METVQMEIEVLPLIILLVYLVGMLSIGFLSNKFMILEVISHRLGSVWLF